jgi:DNA invertase Pin-like site-specific DNA recombinase
MLSDLRAGPRDAVIVYNLDRLHRRPVELEEFVALCEHAGVWDVATVSADIDLGNDDGLFMARIFAAFAARNPGAIRTGASQTAAKRRTRVAARVGAPLRVRGRQDHSARRRGRGGARLRAIVAPGNS